MNHDTLKRLRHTHPAWRLLAADNAPLIISFLHHAFIAPNIRTIAQGDVISRREDFLFHLRQDGEDGYPKQAHQYLDDWTADERGWLRKYYPTGSDEPSFDISAATEKAIEWIAGLGQAVFQDLQMDQLGYRVRLEQERIPFGLVRQALDAIS